MMHYLDYVCFNSDKWTVMVGDARSVRSLWFLAVGVSIKESSWLAFGVATLICSVQGPVSPTI